MPSSPVIRLFWDFRGPDARKTAEHHLRHVAEFFEHNQIPFPLGLNAEEEPATMVSVYFDSDRFPLALVAELSPEQIEKQTLATSPQGMVDQVGQTLRPTRYQVLV